MAWSPNGERLAYLQAGPGDLGRVYVMNADGTGATLVPTHGVLAATIAWAPDGTSMVFEGRRPPTPLAGGGNVFTVRVDGADLARLTNNGGSSPSWQPLPSPR